MIATEVMRKALEALENSLDLVQAEYTDNWRHGLPTRAAQLDGLKRLAEDHASAITALRAEIERLGAAPSLTCQTFGEGVAVPCAECNTVLVDSQELAELRAMAAPIAPSIPALSESDTDAGWDAAGGGDAYAAWGVGASWAYALAAQRAGVQIKDPMQELADDSKQIGLEY